jgi:peroxiredoxin
VIENIQDASNNQVITVKALVKPTTNFFVRSMSMDFGVAVLGMRSKRCQLIVSNTTNQRRLYEVKLDDDNTGCGSTSPSSNVAVENGLGLTIPCAPPSQGLRV